MGSNDVPPPHVPSHVVPVCGLLLQIGGGLWTLCYALYARESFRSKSYGMPMFALALNFAWELVYALYVTESELEKIVFTAWLLIDCGLVYGVIEYAKYEWTYAPWIAQNVKYVFTVMLGVAVVGHYAFARWWIDNDVSKREGKFYRGVVGPDTTELGFWSAAFCQAYLSAASLCQLLIRQHSGGVSWSIWATRTLGSIIGLYINYTWYWYFWPEAHEYFVSPFGIYLWGMGAVCDIVYAFALWHVQKTEIVLSDGRKISGPMGDKRKS